MGRSIDDTDCSECHNRQIHGEWSVENESRRLYECYLEWLNELAGFVVNGMYERVFIDNPNLRGFIERNLDDSQSSEILNKLNHDHEFVENQLIDC